MTLSSRATTFSVVRDMVQVWGDKEGEGGGLGKRGTLLRVNHVLDRTLASTCAVPDTRKSSWKGSPPRAN